MDLMQHLPRDLILKAYANAAGKELDGKAASPASSAALVANAFGYFVDRRSDFPWIPGIESSALGTVKLEHRVRFPWRGGRHPWLDVFIENSSAVIGVESKRYEPYRGRHVPEFSEAFKRDVWRADMNPYTRLLKSLRLGEIRLPALDAAQLIKHALALSTYVRASAQQPILLYVYADPTHWPDGRPVDLRIKTRHGEDLERFADLVAGAHVAFKYLTYAQLCRSWEAAGGELAAHARLLSERFHIA